jgi:hypothetical protein
MPIQDPNLQQDEPEPKSIIIMQINLNKSEKAHLDLINENVSQKYDIILIQEPHTTSFNKDKNAGKLQTGIPK